jgi:hypothetical protein
MPKVYYKRDDTKGKHALMITNDERELLIYSLFHTMAKTKNAETIEQAMELSDKIFGMGERGLKK